MIAADASPAPPSAAAILAPTSLERRVFAGACAVYCALALLVLPWAHAPGPSVPAFFGAYALTVFIADLCTAFMLAADYRGSGRPALLGLACAYLYAACMAFAQGVAFPGAIVEHSPLGDSQWSGWIFVAWRVGFAILLLSAVARAAAPTTIPAARHAALLRSLAVTLAASLATAVGSAFIAIPEMEGNNFSHVSIAVTWTCVALHAAALAWIWRGRAFGDTLFLWLALVLVASAVELAMTTASGARFTLGWYASKSSSAVCACLLLAFLVGTRQPSLERGTSASPGLAIYLASAAVLLAAMLLRWFVHPWLGFIAPFAACFGPVAVAVWMGGWRPAAMVAVAGFAISNVMFMPPVGRLSLSGANDAIGLALYALSCALIIMLGESMRSARDRFRNSEERFRLAQEYSMHGYTLSRAVRNARGDIVDFVIEYVNPLAARMAGRVPDEIAGRPLLQMFPSAREVGLFALFCEVSADGRSRELEVEYRGDGVAGCFRNMAVKVGERIALSIEDVTEKKRLETELLERAEQLQRADENKSVFLATLSHELRNPMAPLRNGLALLKARPDTDTARRVHAVMERQVAHMARLVDDLLDVSRIDRGKLDLRLEPVSADAIAGAALETAMPNLTARGHALDVSIPPEPLFIEGDRVRLAQALANVLNNAAKFTPNNGRIGLELTRQDAHATIRVRDNGVGIEPADLDSIFDLFVQVDRSRAQSAGGLGLGLSLVRAIVEGHGGSVTARSDGRDRGAEFEIRLPLARAQAPAAIPELPARGGTHARVLVVDDNEDAATTLSELLQDAGHDVRTAFNGMRALEMARAFQPEVAFVDLNMPGFDGFDVARWVRAQSWGGEVRLVALTGMGQEADMQRTRAAGFDLHLTKPAALEDVLRALVRDAVPRLDSATARERV